MEKEYDFLKIEEFWQKFWEKKGYFASTVKKDKEKFYNLVMFPYPSGKIHMGHVRNYSIGDVIARLKYLQGFNVLNPIGWDSFGLPAENAAIENKSHPATWTFENIDYMKSQLKKLGFSYDWNREIATCKEDYYRWNQWFFIKMLQKGLVEKKDGAVNWCQKCQTVLANEQVEDEKCWRCGSLVEPKDLSQWYFKITHYAQELLDGHEEIKNHWPERVLSMQKNWIGKSLGLQINFKLDNENFPIFTTRPDTIFGVTYMAMAVEHPVVKKILQETNNKELQDFCENIKRKSKIERTAEGVEKQGFFTGKYVIHPFTGQEIPLYVADFVLMEYGTGAVMAVPAHDERDFLFAKKYKLPIKVVIKPLDNSLEEPLTQAYTGDGVLVNSENFSGLTNQEAIHAIIHTAQEKKLGQSTTNYRLKDWLLSRQRYWGTPIPIIYCPKCGVVPEKEENLPVLLPKDVDFSKTGNPLATSLSFLNTTCPQCGEKAKRETDTMDTFVDSSWYYARFCSPQEGKAPLNKEEAHYWLTVDQYVGGIEHAVMHLLYARFFHKVMRDLGLVSTAEPFKKLLTQGMVVANSYQCKDCHVYFAPHQVDENHLCPQCQKPLFVKIDKMSKSKKNGVDPDDMIKKYGADTVRVFVLFASPPEKDLEWNESAVEGSFRFLKRIFTLASKNEEKLKNLTPSFDNLSEKALKLRKFVHKTIKKVKADFIEKFHFNTGIAALMELLNTLSGFDAKNLQEESVLKEGILTLSHLLFPVAPHIAEEIYHMLNANHTSIYDLLWPAYNENLVIDENVTYALQINGKIRGNLEIAASATKEEVLEKIKKLPVAQKYLEDKTVIKEIFVPQKIVNFVVK